MAAARTGRLLVVAVAVTVAVAVGIGVSVLFPGESRTRASQAAPTPSSTPSALSSEHPTTVRKKRGCATVPPGPFAPRRITIPRVTGGGPGGPPPPHGHNTA